MAWVPVQQRLEEGSGGKGGGGGKGDGGELPDPSRCLSFAAFQRPFPQLLNLLSSHYAPVPPYPPACRWGSESERGAERTGRRRNKGEPPLGNREAEAHISCVTKGGKPHYLQSSISTSISTTSSLSRRRGDAPGGWSTRAYLFGD